jgi:phosphoribulokinase
VSRPIILGVVGNSASGKTTLVRGLTRILGEEHVTRVSADDYHRYDRRQRAELGLSPQDPEANHIDILTQHLLHLRRGEPVLKPVYRHRDGTFGPPVYVRPMRFLIVEGLLNFSSETLRSAQDVLVFLAPQEELRRAWKLKRDCTRRGYTSDEVLGQLDRQADDVKRFIDPQREFADLIVSFRAGATRDAEHLDAEVTLCDSLVHPDLSPLLNGRDDGPTLEPHERGELLRIPGGMDSDHAAALEQAVWEEMSFANHLRIRRLGEFTVGTDLHRSDSLALVQLLVLYQLLTAHAALAVGGRTDLVGSEQRKPASGADSALHA